MFVGVRDNGDTKSIFLRINHGQTGAINGNRSFFDSHVVGFRVIFKGKIPTSFGFADGHTSAYLIHMPLHNMSFQTIAQFHGAFLVQFITHVPLPYIGFQKGFLNGSNRVLIAFDGNDG